MATKTKQNPKHLQVVDWSGLGCSSEWGRRKGREKKTLQILGGGTLWDRAALSAVVCLSDSRAGPSVFVCFCLLSE